MYNTIQFLSQDQMFFAISLVLIFVAVFILAYNLMPNPEAIMAIKRLGMDNGKKKKSKSLMVRFLRPLFPIFMGRIHKIRANNYREKTRRKLITANLFEELSCDEFMALKVCTTFVIPLIAMFFATAMAYELPGYSYPMLIALGFYYPDLWVNQRIKVRRREILLNLPYTIDILTLSVEAGLDFIAALTRLIEKTKKNALTEELTQMLREIRLGTSRADALKSLSERLQIEEISSLTTLLVQVDQFGADIGSVLRAQSDQIRTNRFFAAEQAGAKASQLILLPMILCIFPTIFLVILGPYYILYTTKGFF